jgi:hypothetical protein
LAALSLLLPQQSLALCAIIGGFAVFETFHIHGKFAPCGAARPACFPPPYGGVMLLPQHFFGASGHFGGKLPCRRFAKRRKTPVTFTGDRRQNTGSL